ncbi:acyl-CoA dehydrogenase family protein [Caulobacter sp. KR2-114]|uniref:acyl-CoA dehydrogenase family protein n=1 Tax=Caulobacter sp. KR2-114 TaxID=3400912 RepID=UPI003C035669
MPDFGGDTDAFRNEAKAWLEANFPPSLKGRASLSAGEGPAVVNADLDAWTKAMGEKGWGVPTWPKKYGGGGLTPAEARVLQQEMNKIGAWNPIGGMGTMMFGPTLLEFGTEEQKMEHIPAIATQKVRWCQGFSEPGAGSDLASLSTKAEDKGDHFLINGQKIWTSGGQWADMCFCLVRTDTTKKHEGISFLLIDMHQPGVEVRPIKLIAGASPFCETFFTDAVAPKKNLVGPLNGGWNIAKRLLQHERSGISGGGGAGSRGGGMFGVGGSPAEIAKEYVGVDGAGRIADSDLRSRVVSHEMDAKAFQLTAIRTMVESKSNQGPSAATSIMKNAGTKVGQDRAELIIEIMGHQGLGWEGEGFSAEELSFVRGWLGGKATTIFGGSQEIQSNIISKRILGLPDPLNNSN